MSHPLHTPYVPYTHRVEEYNGLLRARTYPPICYVHIQIYCIGDIPMLYATHMYYAPC
jgi:hypothetical protein